MVRFPLNSSKKSLKQQLDLPDKKDCSYGRICLSFRLKKSLKQRLVFSKKNGLQLWPDFLEVRIKKSLKQR